MRFIIQCVSPTWEPFTVETSGDRFTSFQEAAENALKHLGYRVLPCMPNKDNYKYKLVKEANRNFFPLLEMQLGYALEEALEIIGYHVPIVEDFSNIYCPRTINGWE